MRSEDTIRHSQSTYACPNLQSACRSAKAVKFFQAGSKPAVQR